MMTIRKRGKIYRAEGFVGGKRIRVSLGTRDADAGRRLLNRIERALSEGAQSPLWAELRTILPPNTFPLLAEIAGWHEQEEKTQPTWAELSTAFDYQMGQRMALGKMASSTVERYKQTVREFTTFLSERGITTLADVTRPVVEAFKVWRVARIRKKKYSRGATSISLDAAVLHRIFNHALETELVIKNPVRMEGKPGAEPTHGAQPFTGDELKKLRLHTCDDLLAFLLLRHTGLRGSDAVQLTWAEIHFDRREIERLTQKRRKLVVLPIHTELMFALEAEHQRRKPQPHERVLLNPTTGNPLRRPRLYARIAALGKRAGVTHAHPHRFRDTFAVDLLCAGAGVYDVARMLGDTVETVEKHYSPFVPALRERVRRIMEAGTGLEGTGTSTPRQTTDPVQVQ